MANPRKIFSKIYDQYVEKIYRFIFLKVNSQEIAEDLTSETFLRAWRVFQNSNNPKIENPPAFLYQIAKNLVIDHYREKEKFQIVSADSAKLNNPGFDLEEKFSLGSDFENIRQALANLKEEYQNVIIWHYLDDLPISEIAKLLGRTEKATRVLLHRSLKSLKKELGLIA